MLKTFFVYSCLFSAFSFAVTPAPIVQIRLFEIFHLRSVEINSTAGSSIRNLTAAELKNADFLNISSAQNAFSDISKSWIQITLAGSYLKLQAAGLNRSLTLTDTINIAATGAYFFMAIPNSKSFASRPYSGALKIYADGNELCIINLAPLDDYLAGVIAAEMPQAELAALQAQAVAARTYTIKNWQRHQTRGYQFCDLTHCQTYKGSDGVTEKITQAVAGTKNEILTFDRQPIAAYYSSTCGGHTADDADVWATEENQSYLESVADDFCADSPHYRWRVKLSADSLHQIWQQRLGESLTSISITKRGANDRVRELAMMGSSLHLISGEDFRAVTCRELGWNTIKSTVFDLRFEKNTYVFDGRGLGHGLGLCQYGAMAMARNGHGYQKILKRYFPGTMIRNFQE